jgi:hypothetical protein
MARARQFVKRGGRMIILSQLNEIHSELISITSDKIKPSEVYQNWTKETGNEPWKLLAKNFLETVEWCHVYLVSNIKPAIVSQLMLHPITLADQDWRDKLSNSADVLILENPLYISSLAAKS